MPRRKGAQNCKILPWLSRKADNHEGRFIQLGNSLLLSSKSEEGLEQNPFLRLTNGSRFVYLAMALEAGGRREFEFTRSAAQKYGLSNSSLRSAVCELVEAGMIKSGVERMPVFPTFTNFASTGRSHHKRICLAICCISVQFLDKATAEK